MILVLDGLLNAVLIVSLWARITSEAWVRFPYDAPVHFHPSDLLFAVFCALLVIRVRAFPAKPITGLHRIGGLVAWSQGERVSRRAFPALFLAFFGFHLLVHVLRHWSFNTELNDLPLVHQALFRPWDGRPLRSDLLSRGTFLSAHLAFSLFVLAPLTAFVHSDELVFLLQALIVALPLWSAFAFGPLRDLRKYWPAVFAILACSAALRNGLIWDFREDVLAFCFLLLAVLALMNRRPAAYALCLALAMLSKEYVSFVTLFLALPILLEPTLPYGRSMRWTLAAGTVAVSVLWSIVCLKLLVPHFSGPGTTQHDMVRYFPGLGPAPSAVVGTLLTSPSKLVALVAKRLLTREAGTYLAFLLGPFLLFLRGGGWWLAPAVPGILMNLLAERPFLRYLSFHYDWVILPFLIVGFMKGLADCEAKKGGISLRRWVTALTVACAFSGSWPLARYYARFRPSAIQVREVLFLRGLPEAGILGVGSGKALPHLSHVREIRLLTPMAYNPERGRDDSWDSFWRYNKVDTTLLPGHSAQQAERLLLDLTDATERFVASEAVQRGWRLESTSPGGTLATFVRV